MSVGINYNIQSPTFRGTDKKQKTHENQNASLKAIDLDKIPGVDTVNDTMADMANEGKVKSRKAINILMTLGLAVAAFFTGKRITKSIMDSIRNHTIYLDSIADGLRKGFRFCTKPLDKLNPEKGNAFVRGTKKFLVSIPQRVKNYSRTGIHKDIELERYAKAAKTKVQDLNAEDLKRFNEKFINTIAKNGISKVISSTIGLLAGAQTFIEIAVDKNKNGIPDLFEQKSYKEIIEIPQPKIDEKVIKKMQELNNNDDDDDDIKDETKNDKISKD